MIILYSYTGRRKIQLQQVHYIIIIIIPITYYIYIYIDRQIQIGRQVRTYNIGRHKSVLNCTPIIQPWDSRFGTIGWTDGGIPRCSGKKIILQCPIQINNGYRIFAESTSCENVKKIEIKKEYSIIIIIPKYPSPYILIYIFKSAVSIYNMPTKFVRSSRNGMC